MRLDNDFLSRLVINSNNIQLQRMSISNLLISAEQLQKTVDLKNTHINQLLEQLKKTRELHAQLKKKYMQEQQKLKNKMCELQKIADQLKAQNNQLIKKYRGAESSRQEIQKRYQKGKIQWERENQNLRTYVERLKIENVLLRSQKSEQDQRLKQEQQQKLKRQEEIKIISLKLQKKQRELQESNKRLRMKEDQWKKYNDDMLQDLKSMEVKQSNQNKLTLDELQSRIRDIMIHL